MDKFEEWFDNAPSRIGTECVKWDVMPNPEVIPLWVADMDFRAAPVIEEALLERVKHGVFGYTHVSDSYYKALTDWFSRKHGYSFSAENVILVPGVVPALSAIIKALAPEGSGVIIQSPVYNCFFSSIRNNNCRIADAALRRINLADGCFTYEMDFDALEREASKPDTKVMLLCNPHNPAGRLWRRDELEKVAEICKKNGVIVVSDEIHCELTRPGSEYVPYATVDPKAVVCVSPSKAFNIAGLQTANIVAPDPETRALIDRAVNINEVCDVNPFGPVALRAAYSKRGEEWLDALRIYLWQNYDMLLEMFRKELPECRVTELQATYLPWIDITSFGLSSEELEQRLVEKANVRINAGKMYGLDGYIRINLAAPRVRLREGLDRVIKYLKHLKAKQ